MITRLILLVEWRRHLQVYVNAKDETPRKKVKILQGEMKKTRVISMKSKKFDQGFRPRYRNRNY
jgi:hypothetical protein